MAVYIEKDLAVTMLTTIFFVALPFLSLYFSIHIFNKRHNNVCRVKKIEIFSCTLIVLIYSEILVKHLIVTIPFSFAQVLMAVYMRRI